MKQPKILAYHKVGVPCDLSFCWHDRYAFLQHLDYFRKQNYRLQTLSECTTNESQDQISLVFDDGFAGLFDFRELLLEQGSKVTVFPVTGYIGGYDRWDISLSGFSFKHLNRSQLKQLAADGHEIGSHTHTHRALTALNGNDLQQELVQSRQILEELTGIACTIISLPFGRINERVVDACLAAGYQKIVSTADFSGYPQVLRSRVVYGLDGARQLQAKLGLNRWSAMEDLRLRLFSWAAGGAVMVQNLLSANKKG